MTDYKTDLEILYAIKKGIHKFNEIYCQVHGSKLKFSKRLKMLVVDGVIEKRKNGQYHLGNFESYEEMQTMIKGIKRRTLQIEKDSKKFSNKKLLQASVETTILYLTHFSLVSFHMLFTEYRTSRTAELEMAKGLLGYIKKIYETLEKRKDPQLLIVYYDLVKKYTLKIEELYND